ncbi:Protein kinase C iota type [Heterocephalus glaber]|uniref:non-specific serine/threonine protein kinase n=1 Tax=Heterocephalus glaber TaxID=10181 RepID=G5C7C4_HETGA|nr:Protein kinase C iota type [Heterocephalus glaber]
MAERGQRMPATHRKVPAPQQTHQLQRESMVLLPPHTEHPKVPCPGGKKFNHCRAAGCWRKLCYANGHTFQAKCFSSADCTDHVGRLGLQVYKCTNCKLLVYKKCHKLVTIECGQHSLASEPMVPVDPTSMASDPAHTVIPHNLSTHEALEQGDENEAGNTGEGGKASSGLGLEDFDLLHMIVRGSYGKVLLVQLKKSDSMYAMKAVKKEHSYIHRVQRERHILQQTSNCPFLVALHACFQTESQLFLVLDYVSGGELLFHVQQQSTLPGEHARFYSAEISLAVNYLQQQGILHRNLKLENNFDPEPVWLTPDDNDIVRELDGCEFAGFEYINRLMMYEEERV